MSLKTTSISRTMFVGIFVISTLSLVTIGILSGINEYERFEKVSVSLRHDYIEKQKDLIRNEVEKAVDLIHFRKSEMKVRINETVRARVYEAYSIAMHLYKQFHGQKSDAEVSRIIIEALRNIRFNNGRGYYFATGFNGICQLWADRPEFEGKSILNVHDSQGNRVVRDLIDIARNKGEGFYRYYWTKPNTKGNDHVKIAFVKQFAPLNWYIGTGEYLSDVEEKTQEDLLHRLVKIRFGTNGYIYGSTLDGDPLFTNGTITKGTANIWDLTDPNGVKIIQEQRKAAANAEGGYYRYAWKKLTTSDPLPKLSFTESIPEWNWMIGAGVYLDEVEKDIAAERTELNEFVRNQFIRLFAILVLAVLLSFFLTYYISSKTRKAFNNFIAFFDKASTGFARIDPSGLIFREFRELAVLANKLVKDREKTTKALSESEAQLKKIAASYPSFLSIIRDDYTVIFTSGQEFEKLQMDPQAYIGKQLSEVYGDGVERVLPYYEQAFDGEAVKFEMEMNDLYLSYTVMPLTYEQGKVSQVMSIVENVTERKRADERIKIALKEKETLLQEIHHRVKNNLAVVSSLLKWQADKIDDPRIREALFESQNRVNSMAAIHETLYQSESLSHVDMDEYVSNVARSIARYYQTTVAVNLVVDCNHIAISAKQASPVGLIVNELLSNSYKYAFTGSQQGEIRITAQNRSEGKIELVYADNGVGIPADFDWKNSRSMGLTLVKILAEGQLDGSIDLDRTRGTRFIIRFSPD